jgi:hypothetical protein
MARTAATSESAAQWAAFKVKYGLAQSATTPYGFDTGYVPSFLHYQNGEVIDAEVYDNDTLEAGSRGEHLQNHRHLLG